MSTISVPQAAAMGICLLDRMLGNTPGVYDPDSRAIHPGRCRYCEEPREKLLADLKEYQQDAYAAEAEYRRIGAAERERRLRDAQEPLKAPWYEEALMA